MTSNQLIQIILRNIIKDTTIEIRGILRALASDWSERYKALNLVRATAQSILDDLENIPDVSLYNESYILVDAATWRTYVEKYDRKSEMVCKQ